MTADRPATPATPRRHHWTIRFDRVCCRACGAFFTDQDADEHCAGAAKIRPMATFRQRDEADRPPGYDMPPGPRIDAARRRAAEFFGDKAGRA